MTEKQIVEKIVKHLRAQGFWVLKVHGGGFQTAGLPDLLAVRNGRLFAFEVKKPGGQPTKLQAKRLAELEAAGAAAVGVTSVEEVATHLRVLCESTP
jgi:Holliday junction resolvase